MKKLLKVLMYFGFVCALFPLHAQEKTPAPSADANGQLRQTVEDRFQLPSISADPVLISTITYYGALADHMRGQIVNQPAPQVQTRLSAPYLDLLPVIASQSAPQIEDMADKHVLRVTQRFVIGQFWQLGELDQIQYRMVMWSLIEKLTPPAENLRKQPFAIAFPGIYRHTLIADTGPNMLIVPRPLELKDGIANFSVSANLSSNPQQIQMTGELNFLQDKAGSEQWKAWIDKIKTLFPRLTTDVTVLVLDKQQRDAVNALPGNTESGRGLALFPTHRAAKKSIDYGLAMLQSGRLSVNLQNQVKLNRASAMMLLEQYSAVNAEIDNLRQRGDPTALGLAATVAFAQNQDPTAKKYAEQSLALAPCLNTTLELKPLLDYMNGDYKAVSKLAEPECEAGPEDAPTVLLRHFAARRLGGDDKADLKASLANLNERGWVHKMARYLLDEVSLKTVMDSGQTQVSQGYAYTAGYFDAAIQCRIHFYAGERMMLNGDLKNAEKYWVTAAKLPVGNVMEKIAAKRRLAELAAKKAS